MAIPVTGVNNETFTTSANANSKNASSNSVDPASRFDRVNGGLVVAEGSTGDLRNYNNFSLDRLSVNQALITPKPLLVNGVTAKDKVYDGSKAVELDTSQALTSKSGVVAGDDVSLKTVTGLFVDKNVGTNKRVDLSQIEFNGASKENYMAAAQQTTTANITPKELVVTRLSSLEDDYWFLDCFFNSSQELKKIKCEPISQKKSPSLEIKKYPNKKLSALNSPLLP